MIRYYCPKCKTIIDTPCVSNELTHEIGWKNGVTWYSAIHKVIKVIDND